MKKYLTIGIVIAVMLLSSLVYAGDKPIISGLTGGKAGPPAMTCNFDDNISSKNWFCDLRVIAVFLQKDPRISGAKLDPTTGDYNLYVAANRDAFIGSTFYTLGTLGNWRGGKALEEAGVENALATVPINTKSSNVILPFKNQYPNEPGYWQPLVFMVQLDKAVYKDHAGRAFGGVPDFPDGPWLCRSSKNEVQVWVYVNNKTRTIEFPGKEGCKFATQYE